MVGQSLRVGDLVFYGVGPYAPLGVFLGETHRQWYGHGDTYSEFYHCGAGRAHTTDLFYNLLTRVALPGDDR